MNTSAVSFGKTVKITGQAPLSSANRVADIFNNPRECHPDEVSEVFRLLETFDDLDEKGYTIVGTKCVGHTQAISLDNGENVYLLTGKESERLHQLKRDMLNAIKGAYYRYQGDSDMVSLVRGNEKERLLDLTKVLISETCKSSMEIGYDTKKRTLKYLDEIV